MVRIHREGWLQKGLEILAQEGVEGLKIDRMCTQLDVTKGSFYHHFKNRNHYLESLLQFWEEQFTVQFIQQSDMHPEPKDRMNHLLSIVTESFGPEELALRVWGQSHDLAQSYIQRVDQARLEYLEQLFTAWGKEPKQSHIYSRLLYSTLLGSRDLIPFVNQEDLREMFSFLLHSFEHNNEG